MSLYESLFAQHGLKVAQILLTHEDLRDRDRHLNARNTLLTLLARGVVPVINENDTVAVEEIKFGDNDRLAALVATLVGADLLVILTSVEGLLNEKNEVVRRVEKIDAKILKLARGAGSETSIGGMISKLEAAKIATRAGIPVVIASGKKPDPLSRIIRGLEEGTSFAATTTRLESRKRWIAFFHKPAGALFVDEGAKKAMQEQSKSLLAKGVKKIEGDFQKGDVIRICDENGEFARGLAKVASTDVHEASVVVHRDDMVVL
jgi:glutamate 5-kinase